MVVNGNGTVEQVAHYYPYDPTLISQFLKSLQYNTFIQVEMELITR
jgi:hypothetical protein